MRKKSTLNTLKASSMKRIPHWTGLGYLIKIVQISQHYSGCSVNQHYSHKWQFQTVGALCEVTFTSLLFFYKLPAQLLFIYKLMQLSTYCILCRTRNSTF